jgi:hypothetical protein
MGRGHDQQQLLARHGVLTRESLNSKLVPGVRSALSGPQRVSRRTAASPARLFVAGLGATQFALPGALDLLRSLREKPDDPEIAVLAATDPANPYGAALKWPAFAPGGASTPPPRLRGQVGEAGPATHVQSGAWTHANGRCDGRARQRLPGRRTCARANIASSSPTSRDGARAIEDRPRCRAAC